VLSRLRDNLIENGQRPVWFNAWHRQGEESLFAALMQAVRDEAVPSWWSLAGLDVRMRLLLSRVRSNPIRWLLALLLLCGMIGFVASWPRPTLPEAMAALRALVEHGKLKEEVPKLLGGLSWPLALLSGFLIVIAVLRHQLSSAGLDPGRLPDERRAGATSASSWLSATASSRRLGR
jgi:hypothetical protein